MEKRYECREVGLEFFRAAPFIFEAEEIIRATPDQIFDAFEDAHAWTVWAAPIQKVEWTSSKPYGLGTTRTVHMSGGLIGWETFIAWERGKRMAFRFTHSSQPNVEAFGEDYQVEDLGDGRCRATWTMAMQPAGASRFVMPAIRPVMGWFVRRMFRKFRKLVEAEFVGSAAVS